MAASDTPHHPHLHKIRNFMHELHVSAESHLHHSHDAIPVETSSTTTETTTWTYDSEHSPHPEILGLQEHELVANTESPAEDAIKTGWLSREFEASLDKTLDFNIKYSDIEKDAHANVGLPCQSIPPELRECEIILIPGLFTNKYPGYMASVMKFFQSLQLHFIKAPIDTAASVAANSKTIRDMIMNRSEENPRKVILVGHSKGGVDATSTVALYPELLGHIRAVVCVQSPYAGSPLADSITSRTLFHTLGTKVQDFFGIDPRALEDITIHNRYEFIRKHPYPNDKVPVLSIATVSDGHKSTMAPFIKFMEKFHGVVSDGMVARTDGVVPGYKVVLDGVDHGGTVFQLPFNKYNCGFLILTSICVALDLPRSS